MTRKVAIVIGIGDAKPLPYLNGAINGARAFHDWASKLGYEAKLIVDEEQPVTLAQLRAEFEEALNSVNGHIHRLVVYFAGHGLIREAEEGLWLLSDWYKELRAVAVESLKRRLYLHDIDQIAIFSDSCRSLPPNLEAADLAADPVLGCGPNRKSRQPAIDKFVAAQDGSSTFTITGASPDEDLCLFSGVLMEALWGTKPDAFSKLLRDKITSRSLGEYLTTEVPKVAKRYNRELTPSVSPTFPEGDDVYYPEDIQVPSAPKLPHWPPPQDEQAKSPGSAREILPEERVSPESRPKLGLRDVLAEGTPQSKWLNSVGNLERSLIKQIRSVERPKAFETEAGVAIKGGVIRHCWTPENIIAVREAPALWRIREKQAPFLNISAQALFEFEDGVFCAVTVLPRFFSSVLRSEKGVSALIYQEAYAPVETRTLAEMALAQMEGGALRADAATDLAVNLRQMKHADPVLGVISAYLYDSIGDIDSIRRMAFFYVRHHQPIPYDIALLAQLDGGWREGRLWAKIPTVKKREPRTEAERRNEWTYSKTEEADGEVGGFWPWMRQGWSYLDNPSEDGSTLISPALIELTSYLAPARFSSFNREGGFRLAQVFRLANQR